MKADLNQYQRLAARTLPNTGVELRDDLRPSQRCLLVHGVLKLNGEAGELADLLGKYWAQGHELDRDKLILELGDVLWHVAEIATALDVDLREVAYRNLEKLRRRYPDGFDEERSLNRAEQHQAFVEALEDD